jgi:dihydroorotate dehydrogenase (NAD+) catalytic subunit
MTDISTSLSGVKLRNPTVLASGILGITTASLIRVANSGAGAITTKSIGPVRREGHENPVVVEVPCGMLNAVGLACPSLDESLTELKETLKKAKIPVIASLYGRSVQEFGEIAERISEIEPDFLEANISCPNMENEFGKPFGTNPETSAGVTEAIKNSSKIPLIVKLTPNVSDIKEIAKAVASAGADVISAINSYGPGMVINIETATPVLSNRFGGLTGPAIKPIAIRCVYEIYETVDVPIIGIGGIQTGRDAVEMMMAGATAIGIGTGIVNRDIKIFSEISNGILKFMNSGNYSKIKELIGRAH